MNLKRIPCVLMAVSGLHGLEEHAVGWQGWASGILGSKLGVHPTWTDFQETDVTLTVVAISCTSVGWRAPWVIPVFPALRTIDALFSRTATVAYSRSDPNRPGSDCRSRSYCTERRAGPVRYRGEALAIRQLISLCP